MFLPALNQEPAFVCLFVLAVYNLSIILAIIWIQAFHWQFTVIIFSVSNK